MPDSSVGFLVYNFQSLPVYDVVFSCRMVCMGRFIDGRHKYFFPLLVYFFLIVLSTYFLCSSSHVFSSLPVSSMYSAPHFLHGIWYTSSPCSSSSTLSWDVPTTEESGTSNKPPGSGKLEHPSTETRAITNYLTCTMTSFGVIGTDEVNVIR